MKKILIFGLLFLAISSLCVYAAYRKTLNDYSPSELKNIAYRGGMSIEGVYILPSSQGQIEITTNYELAQQKAKEYKPFIEVQ